MKENPLSLISHQIPSLQEFEPTKLAVFSYAGSNNLWTLLMKSHFLKEMH